ncbi:MAG: hypothetical protein ACH346_07820 [Chthoniobacterales bacterium]
MKTLAPRKILFFFLLIPCSFLVHVHLYGQVHADEHEITAANYCDFLNKKAVNDEQHFYNDEMGSDPDAACIMRRGHPGEYFYEVIAGRENFPISYINEISKEDYCNYFQNTQLSDEQKTSLSQLDPLLTSNVNNFWIPTMPTSLFLMMTPTDLAGASTTVEELETFSEIASLAAMTFLVGNIRLGSNRIPERSEVYRESSAELQCTRSTVLGSRVFSPSDNRAGIVQEDLPLFSNELTLLLPFSRASKNYGATDETRDK